jgi:hypothetical protein
VKNISSLSWGKIVVIFFVVLIMSIGLTLKPYVNYEGSSNGTNLIYGDTHALNFETIPTVINGITAVTSIIIGFSGAIIGLVYREDFKKDKKAKRGLLALAFYSVIPLTFLLIVYNSLIYGALDFALKIALFALIFALLDFILSMLAVFVRLDLEKDKGVRKKESHTLDEQNKEQMIKVKDAKT